MDSAPLIHKAYERLRAEREERRREAAEKVSSSGLAGWLDADPKGWLIDDKRFLDTPRRGPRN